jgi:hypothetical protein
VEFIWIAGISLGGLALAACIPRGSEKEALQQLPLESRLRIYVPLFAWRDAVAPADHAAVETLRLRLSIALPMLVALIFAMVWALSPARDTRETPSQIVEPLSAEPERTPRATPVAPRPPRSEAAQLTPAPPPSVSREALAELRSIKRLYGTAKVKPIYRVHDVVGARITQIDPNSFWAMLGVREGDVVIELHGEAVDNPTTLVALMNALERDEHVELAVRGTDGEVRYLEFRNPDIP